MKIRLLALLAVSIAVCVTLCASCFAADADLPAGTVVAPVTPPTAATLPSSAPSTVAISDPNYLIVADDVLRLDVWGEPQLTGAQMAVTPSGTVSIPFLGEMKVVGLTQTEVAKLIATRLQEAEILADARVQVSLIQMHRPQARILGAVQRPGAFEFKDGDTVFDAVAQGGSYAEDAMLESASLTRKDSDKSIPIDLRKLFAGDLTQNYKLQNGDTLYVPHEDYKNKFYVMGQVYRPGAFSLKDKTDVLTAINLAGGSLPRASVKNTVVVRDGTRMKVDMGRLYDKGDMSQNIALQTGDIVIIPETKAMDWNKISQVISTVVNVMYLRRLGF